MLRFVVVLFQQQIKIPGDSTTFQNVSPTNLFEETWGSCLYRL